MDTPSGDSGFIRSNFNQSFFSADTSSVPESEDDRARGRGAAMNLSTMDISSDTSTFQINGPSHGNHHDSSSIDMSGGSMFLSNGIRRSNRLFRNSIGSSGGVGMDTSSVAPDSNARSTSGGGVGGGMDYYLQQSMMSDASSVVPPPGPSSVRRTYSRRSNNTSTTAMPPVPPSGPPSAAVRRPRPVSSSRSESPDPTTVRDGGVSTVISSVGGTGGRNGHPMEMMWSAQSSQYAHSGVEESGGGYRLPYDPSGISMMSGSMNMSMNMSMSRTELDDDMIRQTMRAQSAGTGNIRHQSRQAEDGDDDFDIDINRGRRLMSNSDHDEEEEQEEEDDGAGNGTEDDEEEEPFQLFSTLRSALSGDHSGTRTGGGRAGPVNRGLFGSSGGSMESGSGRSTAASKAQLKESLSTWHAAFETANTELILVGLSTGVAGASGSGTAGSVNSRLQDELEALYNGGSTRLQGLVNTGEGGAGTLGRVRRSRATTGSGSETEDNNSGEEDEVIQHAAIGDTADTPAVSNMTLMGETVACLKKEKLELSDPSGLFQEELRQLRGLLDEIDETNWMFSSNLF